MKQLYDETKIGEWILRLGENAIDEKSDSLDSLGIQAVQLKRLSDFLIDILRDTHADYASLNLICNVDGIIDSSLTEFLNLIEQGKKRVRPKLSLNLDPCFFVNKLVQIISATGVVETLLLPFESDMLRDRVNSFFLNNSGELILLDLNIVNGNIQEARIALFRDSSSKEYAPGSAFITGIGYASLREKNKDDYLTNLCQNEVPPISNNNPTRWLKEALHEASCQSKLSMEDILSEDTFFIVCCKVPQFDSPDALWLSSRIENAGIHSASVLYVSMACASVAFALKIAKEMLSLNKYNKCVVLAAEYPNDIEKISMLSLLALSATDKLRPFDVNRDGTVLGYGAGVIIVEKVIKEDHEFAVELEDVQTKIGDPNSAKVDTNIVCGLLRGLHNFGEADLYLAHATGTQQGDKAEWEAVNSINFAKRIPVWANKGYSKHLLYASGMPSICAAILFMKYGMVPKIKELETFDFECTHCFPLRNAFSGSINSVILGMFGFSGCNAVIKLKNVMC